MSIGIIYTSALSTNPIGVYEDATSPVDAHEVEGPYFDEAGNYLHPLTCIKVETPIYRDAAGVLRDAWRLNVAGAET